LQLHWLLEYSAMHSQHLKLQSQHSGQGRRGLPDVACTRHRAWSSFVGTPTRHGVGDSCGTL
jgi:hypothetical protein